MPAVLFFPSWLCFGINEYAREMIISKMIYCQHQSSPQFLGWRLGLLLPNSRGRWSSFPVFFSCLASLLWFLALFLSFGLCYLDCYSWGLMAKLLLLCHLASNIRRDFIKDFASVFKHLGNWSAVLFFVILFLSGLGTRVIEE
jgi:hypothetical protein